VTKATVYGVAALAFGGAAIWAMTPPASRMFVCEVVQTKHNGSLPAETTNLTLVFKINKDTWETVSIGDLVIKDLAKAEGKAKQVNPQLPLVVSDTSYTLTIPDNPQRSDEYTYTGIPMTINRVTGELYDELTTSTRNGDWTETVSDKGRCEPSTMKARL
jgi:hypothetical protein